MFCALKGATVRPSCLKMRTSPVTNRLLPALELVPCTMRRPDTTRPYETGQSGMEPLRSGPAGQGEPGPLILMGIPLTHR